MAKGLIRSLRRGREATRVVVNKVYQFTNLAVATTATTTAGFGTAVIAPLPEGNILFLGAVSYVRFLTADVDIGATWAGDYAIGTTATADNVITAATEANITFGAAGGTGSGEITAATAKLSPITRAATSATQAERAFIIDNTDKTLNLNLNFLVDAGDYTDNQAAAFTASGKVEIAYILLLDD